MAILKCKMCGGDIELSADKTFGTCDSCGSTMTFPKVDDEQRASMFNRGNHFRRMGEFDKALAVYERIVQEDENDAEAHWCCALCRFGIEYVEDPNTFEYLPTCHRASFDSFLEDVDYLAALEHSDGITRRQYQKDAAKIAEVQRGILATSQNEEPFDVFICYKESENDGTRTRDSLMAQEIYYQLTEQGRRVFFSRITLEDKAGTEYEPYIFAALNSAKVMIVVTTSAEHVNAVWVKNEWSRFLSLMRKDRSKLLLPCYRDMDPYELPEALSVLQSYDMGKIGFIQDLIRSVNKVLDAAAPKSSSHETVIVQQQNNAAAPLLRRAFLFLEDGEWEKADDFCEQVLNLDPENAEAYLGKLMAELKVRNRDALKNCPKPFDDRSNYKNAYRFGDEKRKAKLSGDIAFINERKENARLTGIYSNGVKAMNAASTESAYKSAASTFQTIPGFKDADALAKRCLEQAEICGKEEWTEKEKTAKKRKRTIAVVTPIIVVCIAFVIVLTTVIIPRQKYNAAVEKYGQEFLDTFYALNVGDVYQFGSYEQDNDISNGKEDIEWLVLAKEGNKVLVISKYALDCQQYHTSDTSVTWETCSLRKWLNGTFLNTAFSERERAMIPSVTVSPDKSSAYFTSSSGNSTTDQVFLLSYKEAETYFSSDSARLCSGTAYCLAQGAYDSKGKCCWWLRSRGNSSNRAAYVSDLVGSVAGGGSEVNTKWFAVRPALWIDLGS
ncbi:MAG: TIR domain-containing protein [Clostridia bacterium]|nr:TIR domain-containing protein [Clostridia bacterium]